MRDFSELNINKGGRRITRLPPSDEIIAAFQSRYGIILPENYLKLLRHSNGGSPELYVITPPGKTIEYAWAVNRFHYLNEEETEGENLWDAMEAWRPILGAAVLPFASDAGGNEFFLDLTTNPPAVRVCIHDEDYRVVDLAPSFEAFIDGLMIDPELI